MAFSGRLELTWTNKDQTLLSSADGRYDYTWVDPSDYRASEVRLLNTVGYVESPTPEESVMSPTTKNLLITGDAMHVLASLNSIPEYSDEYVGKVKLVYIDPPFNTQQTFDHYEDNIDHSIWLTMLRDRLRQIWPLLSDDGSVWVHLDDSEVHRCRSVLDEEFGPENYVDTVIWQKAYSPRNDAPQLSTDQDYILIYSKKRTWRSNRLSRLAARDALYVASDGDSRPWISGDPAAPSAKRNQGWVYAIQSPFTGELIYTAAGRCWGSKQETMKDLLEEWGVEYEMEDIGDSARRAMICGVPESEVRPGVKSLLVKGDLEAAKVVAQARYERGAWPRLYFTKKGQGGLKLKRYLDEISGSRAPQTLWLHSEVGHNRTAKNEITKMFPGVNPFATPKPELLLQRVIHIATNPGDIVLDCFAGSGTTAAVAHKMGRRWVTSELLPSTVASFTKPRLEMVIAGEDQGGISTVTDRVPVDELPPGLTPQEAQVFNALLRKVTPAVEGLDPGTIRALRSATKTADETTVNWLGGGAFTHLVVGPSMFEKVGDRIYIADWAVHSELARAVCAQIKVRYQPDEISSGRDGDTRVVVIDGLVVGDTVRAILDRVAREECVEIWATQIDDAAGEVLRDLRPGSRLRKIPDSILTTYRAVASTVSRFAKEPSDV
ncbi:site-specific DNA-methyltransferase [Subtercola frigoramans]|uniref:DNA modification methylase n=1 Tax=Subtercola frigoramans TaxID=120298 RepID=A0ABS2L5X4_9MICO|nr:site-specific DNA-methyltransferase [Subtercola frigoramans]MBM7472484.1 DNA modification methylase [Subtercola frigoramans]